MYRDCIAIYLTHEPQWTPIPGKGLEKPRSFLSDFLLLYYYYACVCLFLLLHPCCSHARGILCEIHTPCMGFSLAACYTRWSLTFRGEIVVMAEALLPITKIIIIRYHNCISSAINWIRFTTLVKMQIYKFRHELLLRKSGLSTNQWKIVFTGTVRRQKQSYRRK